jgi:hypothetical protein
MDDLARKAEALLEGKANGHGWAFGPHRCWVGGTRYARVDLKLREMLNWSPEMDKLDALLMEIREEMDARRKEPKDA